MKILFAGGGSLGPVTPLIAVSRVLRARCDDVSFVWAGTPDGPERELAKAEGMEFFDVPVAKLPRYVSLRWLTFPFDAYRAYRVACKIIDTVRPDAVTSVGGFTAVPIILAASSKKIPCLIHQLDKTPTLSNRLVAKRCVSVTTSFAYARSPFGSSVVTERISTPTRFPSAHAPSREDAIRSFGLDPARPIVFITGGGQGARAINEAVTQTRDAWMERVQIIHVCGRGKASSIEPAQGYIVRELLDAREMERAFLAATVVVTRAGMGALSEIASLSKASVVVPIPRSHQVENARAFSAAQSIVFVAQEQPDFSDILFQQVLDLLGNTERRSNIEDAVHLFFPTDDGTALAERLLKAAESITK